ncbi:MAG: class I SAM-dependent methyltransferase [Candidatus Cloacimonetes bacterium]|nr:class I SAM-dependent methyltransferase [Candidatus Cloacimonadota bacterium]
MFEYKTSWEQVSDSNWGRYIAAMERDALLKAHQLFSPPLSALDIGADGGRWSILLSEIGWRMTCTDVSSESVDICKKRLPDAKCILVKKEDVTLPVQKLSQLLRVC